MARKIILLVALIAGIATVFTSCQDDSDELSTATTTETTTSVARPSTSEMGLIIPDTAKYPISKAVIPRKYSKVCCYDSDGETYKEYKTLKIKNRAGTIIQEWLYENLRTDMFECYHWSNDPDGEQYGYFYKWKGDLDDLVQADWNYMMFNPDDDGEPVEEKGYHIPNYKDFNNLAEIVGGTANIPKYLNLTYGSNYYPPLDNGNGAPTNGGAILWVDYAHNYTIWDGDYHGVDPNRVAGCGVFKCWPKTIDDDHQPYICYTNIVNLGCNLRLVRTLTADQW